MSNPTELPDLLPCPFCGSDHVALLHNTNSDHRYDWDFAVECECGAKGESDKSDEFAVKVWNRRAQPEGEAPQAVHITPQEAAAAGIECGDTACGGCNAGEPSCIHAPAAQHAESVAQAKPMFDVETRDELTDEQNFLLDHRQTLQELMICFMSWEPQVCVLGNVRADKAAVAIRAALAAQSQGAQADVGQLTKERDGWKEEAEHQKMRCEAAYRSVQMLRDHERADFWVWQGDGTDFLASMAQSKVVLIRADQLRALAALTHEEGLSFGRRHRASMAEEINDLRAQQAAAPAGDTNG